MTEYNSGLFLLVYRLMLEELWDDFAEAFGTSHN